MDDLQMPALILIVDDEPDLLAPLTFALGREGFDTRTATDAREALERAAGSPRPDLILLDWMLPDMPGTEVFRRLRADPRTAGIPLVFVTARADEADRVVGLELGADDYVTKPYSTRELILRVRAVLRRAQVDVVNREPEPSTEAMALGKLRVDPAAHQVWVDDDEVALTSLEFRLLCALMRRKGRVQSRETLLVEVWEDGVSVGERTVDTHVKRLRQKLGAAGSYVETVRGAGYRFARVSSLD